VEQSTDRLMMSVIDFVEMSCIELLEAQESVPA